MSERTRVRPAILRRLAAVRSACCLAAACSNDTAPKPDTFAASPVVFTDATASAHLPALSTSCIAFADFDGDGRPDLLLGQNGASGGGHVQLFANDGGGAFRQAAEIPLAASPLSCTSADYDNDSRADVAIGLGPVGLTLLRGRGDFEFDDVSDGLPALMPPAPDAVGVSTVGFFDYDRDGWLDLLVGWGWSVLPSACAETAGDFLCTGTPRMQWRRGALMHGEGGRGFRLIPEPPLDPRVEPIAAPGFVVAGFIDWDLDGFTDVLVTHEYGPDLVFRNVDGSGVFEERGTGIGLVGYNHGMGSAVGDFDGDGKWDVYVADLGPDQFYFGNGSGTVEDRAEREGVAQWTRYHSGWSPVAGDFNQDGFLDLFVVNTALVFREADLVKIGLGRPVPSPGLQADFAYVNDQAGAFTLAVVEHAAPAVPVAGWGSSAVADYDGDGDLDVAEYYMSPPRFRLLRNDTAGAGHWLALRLRGTASNSDGIGALVTVSAADGLELRRFAQGSTGALGHSSADVHFGLGAHASVDHVEISWPSGRRQSLGPMAVDRVVSVQEPR